MFVHASIQRGQNSPNPTPSKLSHNSLLVFLPIETTWLLSQISPFLLFSSPFYMSVQNQSAKYSIHLPEKYPQCNKNSIPSVAALVTIIQCKAAKMKVSSRDQQVHTLPKSMKFFIITVCKHVNIRMQHKHAQCYHIPSLTVHDNMLACYQALVVDLQDKMATVANPLTLFL